MSFRLALVALLLSVSVACGSSSTSAPSPTPSPSGSGIAASIVTGASTLTRVLSAASLAGFVTGHVVSASTWYPAELGSRDGLKHAGMSLISKIGMDVVKEFWPRRSK